MRWHILAIGKPKLEYARLGVEEYVARLKPFVPVEISFLRAAPDRESAALLDRSKAMFRIVLDETGEHLPSRALASKLGEWELHAKRDLALIVGGADGHTPELRQAAGWCWSLGRHTLQHELALLVALEQLYRAYTIKTGRPYHRD
ncbi:MAG: 23S rRNA (pseudouridine(1915)-N(3))-methyltransferase RlmH [Chthoniobacteraceae bacterium]